MPAIKDTIIEGGDLIYEGSMNIAEFLKTIRGWMKRNNYDITEKDYDSAAKGKVKTTKWRWECDKKVDDSHKYLLKIKFGMADAEETVIDGEKVSLGKFKVSMDAELERDYDNHWKKPSQKFFHAIYERFIREDKETRIIRRLKQDYESFQNEIKRYLNLE